MAGERLLGRLVVGRPVEGPGHDRAALDLAEELARRVTGLLEVERVATRERQLSEAEAALAAASTVGEAAEALARALRAALDPFGVVVFTAHPDDPARLHLQHNIGYPPEFTARFGVFSRDTHGPTAAVLRHGRPVWMCDRGDWRTLYPEVLQLNGLRGAQAGLVVPLRQGGRTLGVVAAVFATAREFPSDERSFVLNLVGQAAGLRAGRAERRPLGHRPHPAAEPAAGPAARRGAARAGRALPTRPGGTTRPVATGTT